MTTTTWARWRRGAVLVASAAIVATLLPATSAGAAPLAALAEPAFAYLDAATGVASSNDAAGTAGMATQITPSGNQVFAHDVSWDGRTWVGCVGTGAPTADPYDRTYGLVLVHSDGTTTSTKVLSTYCEGTPVVSGDGAKVYWIAADTVYRFDASYATGIAGTTSVVSSGQFVAATDPTSGDPTELVDAFTVSRDGLSAAVLFRDTTGPKSRVHATLLSTGAPSPAAYDRSFTSVVPQGTVTPWYDAQSSSFAFVTDTQLAYGVFDRASATPDTLQLGVVSVPASGAPSSSAAPVVQAGYDGTYDLRPYGDATAPSTVTQWYVWKHTPTGVDTFDEQLGSSADFVTAPTAWATRADGATTERYLPTAVTPPVWSGPVSDVATPHPVFGLLASSVLFGRQVGYQSYSLYGIDPLGAAYTQEAAAEVDRGLLERSYDGVHYSVLRTTSGRDVKVVGDTYVYGYTPRLARNTWFRWTYQGDVLTAGAAPIVRAVKVVPLVTVKVGRTGSKRTVYGVATRQYGKAVLWRKVGRLWRVVAYASITSRGGFNFGKRTLVRGAYRVSTASDRSWAIGVKAFPI